MRRLSTLLTPYTPGPLRAVARTVSGLPSHTIDAVVDTYGHLRALAWSTPDEVAQIEGIDHPTAVRLCVAAQRAVGRQ